MLKEWKSKRQLSLFVALALSAGGGGLLSDFQSAYAADVTGGNVVVDAGHPAPTPVAAGNAHDIPGATDNRNVTGNKLTISGETMGIPLYGGYTQGAGDATHNEVVFKNGALANGNVYDGWSANGNATHNTITLSGTAATWWNAIYHYGGASGNPSADVTTGNLLKVTTKDNHVYGITNFEKMQFDLSSGIASGDTMLQTAVGQTFDWGNISVTGAADWAAANGSGSKRITLYTNGTLTLNNYNVTGTVSGNYENRLPKRSTP